jgi:hypothetical protein
LTLKRVGARHPSRSGLVGASIAQGDDEVERANVEFAKLGGFLGADFAMIKEFEEPGVALDFFCL